MNKSNEITEALGEKLVSGRDLVDTVRKVGGRAMIGNLSLAINEVHVGEGRQMGKGAPTPSDDQKKWLKVISKLSEATALAPSK